MNKSFTLLSLLAFTVAVKLDCGPCCGGCDFDEDGDDKTEPIIETVIDPIDPSTLTTGTGLDGGDDGTVPDGPSSETTGTGLDGGDNDTDPIDPSTETTLTGQPITGPTEPINPEEPTPEPSLPAVATVYENEDCTGDSYEVNLEEGQQVIDIDIDTLFWDDWNDKGASVMVPDYLRLTLWEHVETTGHGEMFYGASN